MQNPETKAPVELLNAPGAQQRGSANALSAPRGNPMVFALEELPRPQRTYLFKDAYKAFIIRSPKKVGSLGSRYCL